MFETCCCHHHIEFDLHYQVFQNFVEDTYGFHVAPPSRRSELIYSKWVNIFYFMWQNRWSNWSNKLCQKNMWNMWWISSISFRNWKYWCNKKIELKMLQMCEEWNKVWKETKRLEYVEEELPIVTFMDKFKNLIQLYIRHAFFAKWQAQQFQTLRDNFSLGMIVSVVDFAENYSFVHQKIIQSDYFFSSRSLLWYMFVIDMHS